MSKEQNYSFPMLPAGVTAVDPVCGMTVSAERAAGTHMHRGTTYYFCNPRCLERFKADPERYLQPRTQEVSEGAEQTEYTCPMDPDVRQRGPGACPKCGMALEAATFV